MRVKMLQATEHTITPSQIVAYKADTEYTVPREFGEMCVENGTAKEITTKRKRGGETTDGAPPVDGLEGESGGNGKGP